MNSKLLIHSIMRQTTVLIAQLSTAAGIRAPLAHLADQVFVDLANDLADQVFVDLVNEIESQGVGRKVVADMFGLALRTYQKRVQRLSQSVTAPDMTLWQAMLDFLIDNGSTTRRKIFDRFKYDGEGPVAAMLNDLVNSGLVYATGRGDSAVYGITSERDQKQRIQQQDADSIASMVWLSVYRQPQTLKALSASIPVDAKITEQAVEKLINEGCIQLDGLSDPSLLRAETFLVPVGTEQGWEAAVFDHFRTVANAIAAKVQQGKLQSSENDIIGGATLTFDIRPGHPYESEVYGILSRIRREINALWDKVMAHNQQEPIPDQEMTKVVFYFGQNVEKPEEEVTD